MNDHLTIVPGKPDKEIADDLRIRTIAALEPVLQIMTEAAKHGFTVGFNLGIDGLQRTVIQQIMITKNFT